MINFVNFLLTKVYNSKSIPDEIVVSAFDKTVADVQYHFPNLSFSEIESRIKSNSNELAIFLFRLGNEIHNKNLDELKPQIHWLLKELCSCEIYFNTTIDVGFYITHGQGTVIGSRNSIGKGFIIHQGCTIGHKKNGSGNGNIIGDDVTMYCNSSIIGGLKISDNSIIGAHVLVVSNLQSNEIVTADLNQKKSKLIK
jgi:serine O-acetyltransferase